LPLAEIPAGGAVGSSSPRRAAYIKSVRPDLEIVPLRGNVPTRLAKVKQGELAATMLARAGLVRLGLDHEITELLTGLLPAPGQGALGIVATAGTPAAEALAVLNHAETRAAVDAERAVLAGLGGGCSLPLGTLARPEGNGWRVSAVFFAEDGAAHEASHVHADPAVAAAACVDGLLAAGALR
jgi:hydroxymethylbilane synthase